MKYLSCKYLRHAIQFWTNEISFCCQSGVRFPDYFTLETNYKGETDLWDIYTQRRIKHLENMKNGILTKYCDGCIYAVNDEWEDYVPYVNQIIISHWTDCNCNCAYCELEKHPKNKPYKFMPILKEMKKKGLLHFDGHLLFGGGEPCCLKEFDSILKFFFDNKIADVQINSSGIKYSRSIAKYLSIPPTKLTISPDSADRDLYKKIKRVDKSEEVWKNIAKYVKAQKNNIYGVRTKYIILPGINTYKQQIKSWLIKSAEVGVNVVIMDIESKFFAFEGSKYMDILVDLFDFFEDEAEKLGLKVEYYSVGEFIKPYMRRYRDFKVNKY